MSAPKPIRFLIVSLMLALFFASSSARAQQNQVMGELQFSGTTKIERNSGVWVDGQCVGLPEGAQGRQEGYAYAGRPRDLCSASGIPGFHKENCCRTRAGQPFPVTMTKDLRAQYPAANAAELKLNVTPERAAVFVDDAYIGHASDFGGAFHAMLVSPGKHRIKVELPGYQTFETEINLLARQKSELKTELARGSIEQAGALIKEP